MVKKKNKIKIKKINRTFYISEETLNKLKIDSKKLNLSLNLCLEKMINEFLAENFTAKKKLKYGEGVVLNDNIR